MIVYIASYPRSGNFWLQTLIGNQFKKITTNIHVEVKEPDKKKRRFERTFKNWYDIDVLRKPTSHTKKYPEELSEWLAWYKVPGFESEHPFLIPGCKEVVKIEDFRRFLSEDDEWFFLKTHFLPYDAYFPGEYVIQVVRNPGAVIWSFYNFKRDVKPEDGVDLSSVIKDDYTYGSWSAYHSKWINITRKLKSRYLLIQYENIKDRELSICEETQSFLGLPIISSELRSFDYYHKMRPSITRKGKTSGWEEHYSEEQLRLLWKEHGKLMNYYGYGEPQYSLGSDKKLY